MSKIHAAKIAAMRDVASRGIAKDKSASLGGAAVKYRGIEAAMNEMSAVLIRAGISVSAAYSDLTVMERAKGDPAEAKATRFVTLRGTFTWMADDGSHIVSSAYGEAMDSGDKAVTKAQSVAFRTALFQEFVIPTMAIDPEDDPESQEDAEDHLPAWEETARQGVAALQTKFNADKPDSRFWQRHGQRLKQIAAGVQ